MSEKAFDFGAFWGVEESRRFLDALKQKKIDFCKQYGLPIPAFDKEEDFFVTTELIDWAQGKEPEEYLKPCPFCGGEAKRGSESMWGEGQYIICTKCGCKSKSFWGHEERNKREAKDFWNTRARI